jgi:HTH-type transcriptional regulator/antitoxin HigA
LLAHLVEVYEKQHHPVGPPDPLDAIRFRMEQAGLSQRDLVPYLGSASRVSEVLRGLRPLTLKMIRALYEGLGVPAESLLGQPGVTIPEQSGSVEWERFPLREMVDRGWLGAGRRWSRATREQAEELLRAFFGHRDPLSLRPAFRRQHVRRGSAADEYALIAWAGRVLNRASETPVGSTWNDGNLDSEFVGRLVALSTHPDGPVAARDQLAGTGVRVIIERHLPGTHLDGAAMSLDDGSPVVALTLRYDRLDNFWYTLCHELAHVALHHRQPGEGWIADDLEAEGSGKEDQADALAARWLIPTRAWSRFASQGDRSSGAVTAFARQLGVHPAIVAGRIRRDARNYRLLSRMVGHGQVRALFGV